MDWDHWKVDFQCKMLKFIKELMQQLEYMESPIERIAALELVKLQECYGSENIKIRHQYEFKNYVADFLVWDILQDIKIIVECDGHDFHEKTKSQVSKDKRRDREFIKAGYKVLRYSGRDITDNPRQIFLDLLPMLNPPKRVKTDERGIPYDEGNIREAAMEKHC